MRSSKRHDNETSEMRRSIVRKLEQCSVIKSTIPTLGVHVHGDPVFSRSIGVVGVAHDRGRVRVDDDIQQRVFGNDVVRAAHQRVAR